MLLYYNNTTNRNYILDINTKTQTQIPFLNTHYEYRRIGNLLLFFSSSTGVPSGIAKFEKGQLTLIKYFDNKETGIFKSLNIPDNVDCEWLILNLLNPEYTNIFTDNILPDIESYYEPIFSNNCKLIVAFHNKRLNVIRIELDKFNILELNIPTEFRYEPDMDRPNYLLTEDDQFILWSNQIIYIYNLNTNSGWKSLIRLSGNNGIYMVESHKNGLLIYWSNDIRYDSEGFLIDDRTKSDVIDHGNIIGNPVIMTPFFMKDDSYHPLVLISNYDMKSNRITFHLNLTGQSWGVHHATPGNIINDLILYPTHKNAIEIYDPFGKLIPYGFSLEYGKANTLMIDVSKGQFRLLSETLVSYENTGIQYHIDKDGLYVAISYDPNNDYEYILPGIIYYDRRISFLQRLADYRNMFIERNIPLPEVYPNNLILKNILQMYGQRPNDMFGDDLSHGVLSDREFREIFKKLLYG